MRPVPASPLSPRLARRAKRLWEQAIWQQDQLPESGPLARHRSEVDVLLLAVSRCTSRLAEAGSPPRLPRHADAAMAGAILQATRRRLGRLIWPGA